MSTAIACEQVRELIGALVDGELQGEERSGVESHLVDCSSCRQHRHELVELKREIINMALPEPATLKLWESIGSELRGRRPRLFWAQLAGGVWKTELMLAAATFVVALGLGYAYPYLSARTGAPPAAIRIAVPPVALTVGDYVEQVTAGSPEVFWSRYAALDVKPDTIAGPLLAFRPRMPRNLPGGYRLTSAKLLKDVCCYTVQLRYESAQGRVDVFECHDDHPVSFGDARRRRGEHSGIAYTSLDWDGTSLVGRVFSADDVNIILVGDLDKELADQMTEELLDAND